MDTRAVTTSASSRGGFASHTVRLGLSLLLVIGPIGTAMSGVTPYKLPLPAIVVLCFGLLLVQLVWSVHPGTRKH